MPSSQFSTSTGRSGSESGMRYSPERAAQWNWGVNALANQYADMTNLWQTGMQQSVSNWNQTFAYGNETEAKLMRMMGVEGGGWGIATPAANKIGETMRAAQGKTQGQMISSGLGNSTILASMTNQNALMGSRAYSELGANLANYATGHLKDVRMQGANLRAQGAQALA